MASSGPSITGGDDLQMSGVSNQRVLLAGSAEDIDSGLIVEIIRDK